MADRNSQIPDCVSRPPHMQQHRTVSTHKNMQKNAMEEKKNPPDPNPGGQKANQNT